MSQLLIERACERFRKQLSTGQEDEIQRLKNVDDVRHAIQRVEQQMAARQSLRNFDRLTPFLNAIDRLTKPIDVLCNGTPFMPYAWAPLKLILVTAQHYTHALDKLVGAYGSIGVALPRLTRYGETFPDNHEFQRLLAYLYTDIIDFHSRALHLLQKPGWKIFFSSAWGRFEHQFDALIQSIAQTSELIDKEAVALDINLAQEWRQKFLEDAAKQEKRWEAEQRKAVLQWLEVGDSKSYQEDKLDLLRSHCCDGTSQWLTKSKQIRSWLQFNSGHSSLWLHGKPGSGKSILCSQLIAFLRADPNRNCVFFFCDFHTKSYAVTTQILRHLCVQLIDLAPELVSYIYDESVIKGSNPFAQYIKKILPNLIMAVSDLHIIIDGIDEVDSRQHRELIRTLASFSDAQVKCKIMFSSQNIRTISSLLDSKPQISLSNESESVAKDIDLFVTTSLEELNDTQDCAIRQTTLARIRKLVLEKAEGMFLWVHLILEILKEAVSVEDLQLTIESLPQDLAGAYSKILTSIIKGTSDNNLAKQRRVFGWMLFAKGNQPLRKHELRIAMTLHSESYLVSKENNPFPNALDICKPFIEEGPRGSVVFIHSTVPKFLLDDDYGPFVNRLDSSHDISVACIGQLLQSLYLVEERSVSVQRYQQIGYGFHSLLPYAIEYWDEHLADYFEAVSYINSSQQLQMAELILRLSHEHNRIQQDIGKEQNEDTWISEKEDHRLNYLKGFPSAYNFLDRFMHFKRRVNTQEHPSSGLSPDPGPTLFWSIRQEYHKTVIQMLKKKDCQGLRLEELNAFIKEFGPTAFVCDVRGCEQSRVGYSTLALLKDHEAQHQGLLKCLEPDCSYNEHISFSSWRQLKAHKRKIHPEPSRLEVPQKLRRQKHNQEKDLRHKDLQQEILEMLNALPAEQRAIVEELAPEKLREVAERWKNKRLAQAAATTGSPATLPTTSSPSPRNILNIDSSTNKEIPAASHNTQEGTFMTNQPPVARSDFVVEPLDEQTRPDAMDIMGIIKPMDAIDLPPQVFQLIEVVPPGIRKWGPFNHWLRKRDVPPDIKNTLATIQMQQFRLILQQGAQIPANPAGSISPLPQIQPPTAFQAQHNQRETIPGQEPRPYTSADSSAS